MYIFFPPSFWCGSWEGLAVLVFPARTAATVVLPFYLPLFCSWLFHMSPPTGFCLLGLFYLSFCLFVCLSHWPGSFSIHEGLGDSISSAVKYRHYTFLVILAAWPDLQLCTDCREDWNFSLKPKLKSSRGILMYKEMSSRVHEAVWLMAATPSPHKRQNMK